ncbi:MAG: hypothetical protein WAL29_17270, partial [Bacteroidales bacterium]
NKQRYLDKKEYDRNLRKLRKRLGESELKIEIMEAELLEMDKLLMNPAGSEKNEEIYKKYEELKGYLNEEMNKWAGYSHEIELFLRDNN